jgi:hypothetical protein
MTFPRPRQIKGEVVRFNGTDGERAANKLTHAWEQVPNPCQYIPITARQAEQLTREEALKLAKPSETVGKCSKCGCWFNDPDASWKCGEAPRYTETKF